jgi:hypothetical protein
VQDVFFQSFEANLRPFKGRNLNITASTGRVGEDASEFWTSGQTAFSVAIWALTNDVYIYDHKYNIPLNCLCYRNFTWPCGQDYHPTMLHYHHLLQPSISVDLLLAVLNKVKCTEAQTNWFLEKKSMFENTVGL